MKHISNALLALCLLLPVFDQAQPLYVKKLYRSNPALFMGFQSTFLLAQPGNSMFNFGTIAPQAVITKLDSTGNLIWSRSYLFSSNPNLNSKFVDAANSYDSTFVAVGRVALNNTDYRAFCVKFKPNGDTLWCRQITCASAISMMPHNINSTLDSGSIVCGLTTSLYISGPEQHAFVAKLTKNGTLSWIKTLNTSYYASDAYTIKQTPDSGYIFTGELGAGPSWRAIITKLDKSGNFSWQKQYSDVVSGTQLSGHDLLIENDGYLCLLNATINRPLLLKTDFSGNPVWAKTYNLPTYYNYSSIYDRPLTLRKHIQNSRQITGKGEAAWGSWTMAVDTLGNVQWKGEPNLTGIDVMAYKNKNLAVMGDRMIVIDGTLIGPGEIGLMILDSMGSSDGACYLRNPVTTSVQVLNTTSVVSVLIAGGTISAIQPTLGFVSLLISDGCMLQGVGIDKKDNSGTASVYPNPSEGKIIIHSELLPEKPLNFELYDVTGRMLLSKEWNSGKADQELDLYMLDPALYFYALSSDGRIINTGKLLISKLQ